MYSSGICGPTFVKESRTRGLSLEGCRVVSLVHAHGQVLQKQGRVSDRHHDVGVGVRLRLRELCGEGLDLAGEARDEIENVASEGGALLEIAGVEAGDDSCRVPRALDTVAQARVSRLELARSLRTRVIPASPQRALEVGVLVLVGVDDLARREDDPVADHLVSDKPLAARKEEEASHKGQAAHAAGHRPAAGGAQGDGIQGLVYLSPSGAGPDPDDVVLWQDLHVRDAAQVDRDAILDVG